MTLPEDGLQKPRRFYKVVAIEARDDGHAVCLDGRPPRSPGGKPLILPTPGLAALAAQEWSRQGDVLDLGSMAATRLAYTALEKTAPARLGIVEEVARYAGSDALCYWAEAPADLVALQQAQWGGLLAWAHQRLGLTLVPTTGIVHRAQPEEALDLVRSRVRQMDDFALIGTAHATGLFGSAVLALALQDGRLTGEEAHDLARLEETYQESRWGIDAEAAARTAARRTEALMLEAWFSALR
ncbi:MAG: ATP12 family protein [Caulobacter sp.]|nr:ATP12 family protein [Caulobacter sp.]